MKCGKCINWKPPRKQGNPGECKLTIRYTSEDTPCPPGVLRLLLESNTLRAENEVLKVAMQWIAKYKCTKNNVDSSNDCPCDETGLEVNEYCLPCYAKTILKINKFDLDDEYNLKAGKPSL